MVTGGEGCPALTTAGHSSPLHGHHRGKHRVGELHFHRDGRLLWDQPHHKELFKQLLSYTALQMTERR